MERVNCDSMERWKDCRQQGRTCKPSPDSPLEQRWPNFPDAGGRTAPAPDVRVTPGRSNRATGAALRANVLKSLSNETSVLDKQLPIPVVC